MSERAKRNGPGEEASARLVSLNVGEPRPLAYRGRRVSSGIRKSPVERALRLGSTGLEGDGQGDLKDHGGPDKAACVYPIEHYAYWEERLGRALEPGAFGENFGVEGLTETEACVGDVYAVGAAVVQVSQPRQPCYKLAARHGIKDLALRALETGRTGFYVRVLEEGEVRAGDGISRVQRPAPWATVTEANRVMHHDERDRAGAERLLDLPELSASWRRTLEKRLTAGER